MALWFDNYATSPIIVIVYDISIPSVCDVALLLSMMFKQSRSVKTDFTDLYVIKLTNQVSPPDGFYVSHSLKCIKYIFLM